MNTQLRSSTKLFGYSKLARAVLTGILAMSMSVVGLSSASADTLVTEITVSGAEGATTITANGGTLQMNAVVTPIDATDSTVAWSVTPGTGTATIDQAGLLTATGDGTVTVVATANDAGGVQGVLEITISNQVVPAASISPTSQTIVGSENSTITASLPLVPSGMTEVTYSVTLGTLPEGLSLNPSTGVVSGFPTTTYATNTVTITGVGTGGTATTSIEFTISAVPTIPAGTPISLTPMTNADNEYSANLSGSTTAIPVTLKIPSGATGSNAVTFNIQPASSSDDSYRTLTLTATRVSGGAIVTSFEVPIIITIPTSVAASALPAWSSSGAWTAIPELGSDALPVGQEDGFWNDGAGNTKIYTRHLTSFGYRQDQATVSLTAASSSVTAGGTVALTASGGSGTIAYTYATSTSGICSVSGAGVVTSIAAGTCSVTATNPSSGTYIDKTSSAVSITVNAASSGGGGSSSGGASSGASSGISAAEAAAIRAANEAAAKAEAEKLAAAKAAEEAKAALEAAAKAAADKAALEKAAAAKAAADKLEAERNEAAAAIVRAEEAKVAAAIAKAEAVTVRPVVTRSGLKLTLDLPDKYFGKIVTVYVGTTKNGRTTFKKLDFFALDKEDGTATISSKVKLTKGQIIRVNVGKTVVQSVRVR